MISIDKFVQSKYCPSGLDKIHGQRTARVMERSGDEVLDTYEIPELELERQEVEKIIGKDIYYVDKGNSPLRNFFDELRKSNPEEILQVSDNIEEIIFDDFSVFRTKTEYWGTYMDVREVMLPPKVMQTKGPARLYIISSGKVAYMLPKLEYPKTIAPFLKWLKKKKRFVYSEKPFIWNKDMTKGMGDTSYNFYLWNGMYQTGYPIKNIRTTSDIVSYNSWLCGEYKKKVEDRNNQTEPYFRLHIPSPLNPVKININQADVDEFIDFWNNKYQVKR